MTVFVCVMIILIKGDEMSEITQFSIDACADILKQSKNDLYKKCLSVYVLADDLIEDKNEWLTGFLSPDLYEALKKMKTPVRCGALLRGVKMAIESAFDGASMQEVFTKDMPEFLSHSSKSFEVSWVSCPEVKLKFALECNHIPAGMRVCLLEDDCFKKGIAFCMDSQLVPAEKLASEYDVFYHTQYPQRAKEFETFVEEIIKLNHLTPLVVSRHDKKLKANKGTGRTIE